jgi:hypothetical protein
MVDIWLSIADEEEEVPDEAEALAAEISELMDQIAAHNHLSSLETKRLDEYFQILEAMCEPFRPFGVYAAIGVIVTVYQGQPINVEVKARLCAAIGIEQMLSAAAIVVDSD